MGKTTVALWYSMGTGCPYVGADAIAAEIEPESPASAAIEAGRRFVAEIDRLIVNRESFVVESTLSGRSFLKSLQLASNAGYQITIMFLYVDSADVCVSRVAERVRKAGHFVPELDIRRRFGRSLRNFWSMYRHLADEWMLCYNGNTGFQEVSAGSRSKITILDAEKHADFLELIE